MPRITKEVHMRKNRFCTFTLISALFIAALPSSLAIAGNETGSATVDASVSSLPVQQEASLTISLSKTENYDPDGSKFTAYQVMSLSQTDGEWKWAMANGFVYPDGGTFEPDALGTYPAARMQELAGKLALQVNSSMTDVLAEKALSNGTCSWTTSKLGIYLVCETGTKAGNFPSAPFLVSLPYTDEDSGSTWKYAAVAHPKGSTVGLEKLIHQAKGSYNNTQTYEGDKDTVAIGDEVQYLITTRIPNYTAVYFENGKNPTFKLTDKIAKGLTLKPASVNIALQGTNLDAKDYTKTIDTLDDGRTALTIDLASAYLSAADHQNKDLVLSYSVDVNDNASLADSGNENVVTLDYSYDPLNPDKPNEIEDKADVYTFGIEIEKFDGDSTAAQKTKLEGAQFALYKEKTKGGTASEALSQNPYRPVGVTDKNGILDFKGLDAGTYYLKEVKAPDDYSLLVNPIKVEIIPNAVDTNGAEVITEGGFTVKINDKEVNAVNTEGVSRILAADNREDTVIVSVANHKGFSLPMSGGRGIALILIIAAAGLMAVTVLFVKGNGQKAASNGGNQA